jgi:hypothetical protein
MNHFKIYTEARQTLKQHEQELHPLLWEQEYEFEFSGKVFG